MPLEIGEFDLWQELDLAVDQHREDAGAKGLQLALSVEASIPRFVCGDPVRLRQVLLPSAEQCDQVHRPRPRRGPGDFGRRRRRPGAATV